MNRFLLGFVCVATAFSLAACGGGGGTVTGSSGLGFGACSVATVAGNLIYTTDWGSAPAGASQVLQIIDTDGFVVRTDSLNRGSSSTSTLNVSSINAAVYRLKATIYSGANASGTVLGVTDLLLDLCAGGPGGITVTASTQYGVTPTSVQVSIPSLTLTQQQTAQYIATAFQGGRATFVDPSLMTWSVAGGVGTISTAGVLTATTAGSGSVSATYNGAVVGSAPVTVNQKIITQSKWTVLVYINAANDLYSFSDLNVNQMEQVAGNPDVRFVLQWKQSKSNWSGSSFDGVRRYLVKQDSTSNIASELVQSNIKDNFGNALDMGKAQTLNDFIKWGKANYPADRYCLVLWNHGNGWSRAPEDDLPTRAFSYDDQYNSSIKTWETDAALAGEHFDIIAWDASLMQMMEVAYEARSYADYIVGSEESPPGEGYPYQSIFNVFRDNPDATTATLTKAFVDGMVNNPPYATRKITQSVIDTTQMTALATALHNFAQELISNKVAVTTAVQTARATAQSYSPNSTRTYRDIIDLCLILEADATVPANVKTAAANARAAVDAAIIWEGHNAQSPKSNGLSIDFSSQGNYSIFRTDYERLKFAQDTFWNEWLGQAP
ncbi:MAG: hypothetical protein KDC26_10105 [Armatimonadetes bacterium]|nr:hypothetical protein [Armatimonadota bacterium]